MKVDCGFPAWMFQNAYPDDLLHQAIAEFPAVDDPRWQTFHGEHEASKQQGGPACWGPATTTLIIDMLSPSSCKQVADLIGVDHLVGDVVGGGMHQSGPGARLGTHVDFDRHPGTGWRRKVNLLLYLNHGWREDWGGCLELGDKPVVIAPEFGRMVIFECSDRSWHGHPRPVAEGRIRRSIACYYYDPDDTPTGRGHSTVWRNDG